MIKKILSNLIITKVYSVSTLFTAEGVRLKKENRPCWAAVLKHDGETLYHSGGVTLSSNAKSVIFLPKGCTYDWVCVRSGRFSIIEFESTFDFPKPFVCPTKNTEKLIKLFSELEYNRNMKSNMLDIESIQGAYTIFLSLTEHEEKQYHSSEKHQKIEKAIEYIHQNYNKSITNDELARISDLSVVYFRKLFTSIIGISPIVYAREVRIEKAKEMLGSDYGTLSAVAQSLGYANSYDFSRDFKKHTGISPSKY